MTRNNGLIYKQNSIQL